ncbi:hypothetical protein ABPG74_011176 [Tetrahymena malaccensis]
MDPNKFNDYLKEKKYKIQQNTNYDKDKATVIIKQQNKIYRLKGDNPHKNIAQIYELEAKGDIIIYSHEEFPYTLQNLEFLKKQKNFNLKQVAIDILNGIISLHNLGISHLNLKPSNILLNSKFEAKISDLYYEAKQVCDDDYIYQGPEQLKNMNTRNIAFQSDYFSVGAIISEILGYKYKENRVDIQQGNIPIINGTSDDQLQLSFSLDMMHFSQSRRFSPTQTLQTFQNDYKQSKPYNKKYLVVAILILILSIVCFISVYYLFFQEQYNNKDQGVINDNKEVNLIKLEKASNQISENNFSTHEICKADIFYENRLIGQPIKKQINYQNDTQITKKQEVQNLEQYSQKYDNQLISSLQNDFSFINQTYPISCIAFQLININNDNLKPIQQDENNYLQIEGFWQLNKICIKQYKGCLIQNGVKNQNDINILKIEYEKDICKKQLQEFKMCIQKIWSFIYQDLKECYPQEYQQFQKQQNTNQSAWRFLDEINNKQKYNNGNNSQNCQVKQILDQDIQKYEEFFSQNFRDIYNQFENSNKYRLVNQILLKFSEMQQKKDIFIQGFYDINLINILNELKQLENDIFQDKVTKQNNFSQQNNNFDDQSNREIQNNDSEILDQKQDSQQNNTTSNQSQSQSLQQNNPENEKSKKNYQKIQKQLKKLQKKMTKEQ